MQQPKYVKIKDIVEQYSIPKSTIYHLIKNQGFPKQIKLSAQSVVFKREEIDAWFEQRQKHSQSPSSNNKDKEIVNEKE